MGRTALIEFAETLTTRDVRGQALPRLWFMTDRARVPDPLAVIDTLPPGSGIVLRDYAYNSRPALAMALAQHARQRGLVLVVGSDETLAQRVGAAGVHLPERDLDRLTTVRGAHPSWLITAAAHSADAVARSADGGADAAFLSPIFATASHPGSPYLGVQTVQKIVSTTTLPIIALGGIDATTIPELKTTPIAGIAAIGALLS